MNKDSWVLFELPGFASAASGTKQDSLDALRKASETSYFKDKDALWVKLVAGSAGCRNVRRYRPRPRLMTAKPASNQSRNR